jgi:outer membrane lipoprotein-sorting protein
MILRRHLLILLASAAAGCASKEHLPPYPWTTGEAAIRDLSIRAHAVKALSAPATVTLTRPTGDSIRLDAAVAMQPPGYLRLRAWKFNQSVFDLTVNPDGIFLVSPDERSLHDKIRAGGVSAAQLARMWSLLSSTFFDSPDLRAKETATQLLPTAPFEHQTILCEIDRATLTPRRYMLFDDRHRARFALSLSHYVNHAGILYPHELVASSDSGKIEIDLRDVELNSSLAPGAFKPPRRAEKLP